MLASEAAGKPRDLVFVSYSHTDSKWLDRLSIFLKPYIKQGRLNVWNDPYIRVGDQWRREISNALGRTCVGVLLVSPDFIASDFIQDEEVPPLVRGAEMGSIILFAIPISAGAFKITPLAHYKWAHDPKQPLDQVPKPKRNAILVGIVEEIEKAVSSSAAVPVAPAEAAVRNAAATTLEALAITDRLAVLHGVPGQPLNYLRRDEYFEPLKQAVLSTTHQATGITGVVPAAEITRIGLHGMGGIGKTVLAIDLVNTEEIRRAFPDGIFWLTIGQNPEPLRLQGELARFIAVEPRAISTVNDGRDQLRQLFEGKACLLVLDDLWRVQDAEPFDVLGLRSRLLTTTRNADLLVALGARELPLDVLSEDLALDLLASWSGQARQALPPVARQVAESCGYLPLALALAGARVRGGGRWKDVQAALEQGQLEFLDHPHGSVFKSLRMSTDALPTSDCARYFDLAVFPEDVDVPVETICTLWRHTGRLEAYEAHDLLHSFASKSLLTLSSDGKRVSFHDLQHDFLRLNVESLADAHGALIEAYRRRCAGGWASGPDDGYFFQFLPHHLATAGRLDEVKALLADYAWIKAKLKAISEYVNWVLDREDRRFLEDQLVPLMVREEHYSNMITEADINAARGDLYEMIYSNQKNQHFRRLCDTNILVLEDQYTGYTQKTQRIRFKHESFYEYFIGKRLASLSEMQADRYAFFLRLIEETTAKPFLWDAARNALVKEASKLNSETILKLCRTTEQRVKEMIVNVLIGLDSLEQREGLLSNLIPQEKPASEWQKLRRLVSKPAAEADLRTRIAGKIAIEVASTLKLRQILQTAALHPDPAMRAMAVRYSYYLWQHDRGAGFAVLQYLADNATSGIIPNFLAIESVFGLSFIIVCDSYNDEEVTSMVQSIWHGMIATLFRLRGGDSRWNGIVINFIRERLIALVIAHVFTLLHELPPNNMMHYDAVEAFFQLTPADKSLYRRLVRYFDVTGDYSRTQMKQDYLAVLEIDNVLLRLITTMGLVAHSWAAPHAFLPFLKQLFEAAKRHITTYPYLRAIHNVPISILQRDPMNDEMFEFFVYTAEVSQEYYTRYPEKYQSNASGPPPQAAGIGSYITFQYRRKGTVRTPWLETRIQAALKKRDLRLFEFLLSSELPDQAINQLAPEAVLAALELFFKSENAAITDMIQALLSRLRLYYPDQVDDFLEHQQAPDEFRLQVRTHEPNEKVGDLIGMRAWYFVRDSVLLGPAEGRAQLVECFEKAAEYKDTRAWVDYLIRHLVNLIYGGKALREPA